MKYIIVSPRGFKMPIIFNEAINHSEVARGFSKVDSAGFVKIDYDTEKKYFTCKCYGESVGLSIKSNPEQDEPKIEFMLNSSYFTS